MQHFPDEDSIRAAVSLAQRAPSVHNSQPWRWRRADHSIHLYADWTRQLSASDPDGRDLLLSCGAALHHLRVAFGSAGWACQVHRLPNPADHDHLAAVELAPHRARSAEITSASAIMQRHTDRRNYSSWPVPPGMTARLVDEAADEGVVLRAVTAGSTRARLLDAIRLADELAHADGAYASELALWSGRHSGSVDGVPAAAIPARSPAEFGTGRFVPGTLASAPEDDGDGDGSVLLVLGTASDDSTSRLRAGEATSAVLLAATEYRLATAPLTQPLAVADTRDLVRRDVLNDAMYPQMVIRVGFTPLSATPIERTRRRPIAENYERIR